MSNTDNAATVEIGVDADVSSVIAHHESSLDVLIDDNKHMPEFIQLAESCFMTGLRQDVALEKCVNKNDRLDDSLDYSVLVELCDIVYSRGLPGSEINEADTQRMIGELNGRYAWIEAYSQIYDFHLRKFTQPGSFRLQFANRPAVVRGEGGTKISTIAEAWLRSRHRRQHKDVTYCPGGARIVDDKINFWTGWGFEGKPGPIEPWDALMSYVFGDDAESRRWFEQWTAYPFQNPGAKMNCAVVMWSAQQGVGKTLIGETIGGLYGKDENFRILSAVDLHGPFNGWALRCQFVLGEENASSDHRADSNRLKHLITGDSMMVNEKYQPAISLPNRINFLFTSNHADAFHLETFDRRFFVWELSGERMPDEFYAKFVNWRDSEGGSSALMHHLCNLDMGFTRFSGHFHLASKPPLELGRADVAQR